MRGAYSPANRQFFGDRTTYAATRFYVAQNARVSGTKDTEVLGIPDSSKVYTSHAECQSLTLRIKIAKFHRLTMALSRKLAERNSARVSHVPSIITILWILIRLVQSNR